MMDYKEAIRVAIMAVTMDLNLDFENKGKIISVLRSIERLAEIGLAAEKAFENEYSFDLFVWDDFADAVLFINVLDSVEELIEWAEGEGE